MYSLKSERSSVHTLLTSDIFRSLWPLSASPRSSLLSSISQSMFRRRLCRMNRSSNGSNLWNEPSVSESQSAITKTGQSKKILTKIGWEKMKTEARNSDKIRSTWRGQAEAGLSFLLSRRASVRLLSPLDWGHPIACGYMRYGTTGNMRLHAVWVIKS